MLCAAILALSAHTLSAQNKGDKYVGGMLGVATQSIRLELDWAGFDENAWSTQTTFSIAPQAGIFVCDNLRLGGLLSYQLGSRSEVTNHTLTIGPNLAYYVRLCERFYYTPEVAVGFLYTTTEDVKGYGVGVGLSLGAFEFQPSPHWGIAFSLLSLDYSYISYTEEGLVVPVEKISLSQIDFKLGIKPSVGFRYYF